VKRLVNGMPWGVHEQLSLSLDSLIQSGLLGVRDLLRLGERTTTVLHKPILLGGNDELWGVI
jgi:hypothetical protein